MCDFKICLSSVSVEIEIRVYYINEEKDDATDMACDMLAAILSDGKILLRSYVQAGVENLLDLV